MGVVILLKFHFKYKKSMKKFLLIGALAVATIANAATTKVLQKTNVGSEAKNTMHCALRRRVRTIWQIGILCRVRFTLVYMKV